MSMTHGQKTDHFTYDFVGDADNTTQESVFYAVGRPITDNCMQGYNGTIFAYGQTGSGKTFTMQGPVDESTGGIEYDRRGVIPRCFEYLFSQIAREEKKDSVQYLCRASFCEIYNEFVYDLLDPSAPACTIREDLKRGVYVDGISEEAVSSPDDAYRLLEIGAQNRHVAATSMNRESSRSHSIFTLVIQSKITDGDVTDVRESRFNLVDLAGSERQRMTSTTGLRLKEAANINKSLLALGKVINALVDVANGRQRHIHYRDSKLTFLLRDSLGGNAKTALIANINPSIECAGETLSTLRFAQRAKMIRNRAMVNQEFQGNVIQMQEEIKRLKHELLLAQVNAKGSDGVAGQLESMLGDQKIELEGFDDPDPQIRSHRMLMALLRRLKKVSESNESLVVQMELLQEQVMHQQKQIQTDKMVIKLRDSTIDMFRKKGQVSIDDEKRGLVEEVASLRQIIDHHPEVTRFAAENLQLRQQMQQYDDALDDIERLEEVRLESSKVERALSEKLIALDQRIAELEKKGHGQPPPDLLIKMRELINKHHELRAEKQSLEEEYAQKMEDFESQRKKQKQVELDLKEDLESSKNLIKELESSLEASKLSRDLELRAASASNAEFLQKRIDELEADNSRLRVKYESLEKKSRRLSDFAAQSRTMTQEQLSSMSNRLTQLSKEKDETDAKNAQLVLDKSELSRAIDAYKLQIKKHESDVAVLRDQLTKINMEHEQRIMNLEADIRKRDLDLDSMTQQFENAKIDLEDAHGELDFSREQLEQIRKSLVAAEGKSKSLEKQLKDGNTKITALEQELEQLRNSLTDANDSQQQLASTLHNLAALQNQLDVKEFELENLRADMIVNEEIAQEKIQAYLAEIEATKKSLKELQMRQAEDRQILSDARKQLEERQRELHDAHLENTTLKSVLTEFESREGAVYEELEGIKSKLTNAEKQSDHLSSQKLALSSELEAITAKHEREIIRAEALETKFKALEVQSEQLIAESKAKTDQMDLLQRTIVELTEKSDVLSQANSSLRADLDDKSRLLGEYMNGPQAAELKAELDSRSNRIRELEEFSIRLEKITREYDASRKEKNLEIQKMREEMQLLKLDLVSSEKTVQTLQGELHAREQDFESQLQAQLRVKEDALDNQRRELERYSLDLAKLQESVKSLKNANDRVTAQLESAEEDNQELLDRTKELADSLEIAKKTIDELKFENHTLSQALESSSVKKLETEIGSLQMELQVRTGELKREQDRIRAFSDRLNKFEEIEGQAKSLEQKFEYLLARNEELEEENAKLVRHNNFKQKLQYHLQIKQENNTLRAENQRLILELDRLERRMKEVDPSASSSIKSRMSVRRHL